MKRRDAIITLSAAAAGPFLLPRRPGRAVLPGSMADQDRGWAALERLKTEPTVTSAVRSEHGAPRLFVNGHEEFPFQAVSTNLLATAKSYQASGIRILHPLLGLDDGWLGPDRFDWRPILAYFGRLLDQVPPAFFLPRVHLYPPWWWIEAHPEELIGYALPIDPAGDRMPPRRIDSGFNWNTIVDTRTASLASELWRSDAAAMLRSFIRAVEDSPLRSRVIGYQVAGGLNGEWHYTGSRFLPDTGAAMARRTGSPPSTDSRRSTRRGILRDPAAERSVVEFYRLFHETTAGTALAMCRAVKEATGGKKLAGLFYGYLLENVMIQEAGHLAPEAVLSAPEVDFIAAPYSYIHTTRTKERPRWESDVYDEAGNWLGRARGVAGDGGLRVMAESLRRHGKLFFSEMDSHTYLEPHQSTEGGSGKETTEGTLRILRRDLAQVVTTGIGGWLFDFGHFDPPYKAGRGWYDDLPMIEEIKSWADLGGQRSGWDLTPVAEIAAVCDARSFFATRHWTAESPWDGYGVSIMDVVDHWFLAAQSRAIHRIGAPVDFLYPFDLTKNDASRYKFFLVPNLFFLENGEADRLLDIFRNSGATVLWYYAPGFLGSEGFDPGRMERLTGFSFQVSDEPGPLMIEMPEDIVPGIRSFGLKNDYSPRFAIQADNSTLEVLGRWAGSDKAAFTRKEHQGFHSVYVGAAPVPVEILRRLAVDAGAALWSSKPDVVRATRGAAMIVATDEGERTLKFPAPYAPARDESSAFRKHRLKMKFGDVLAFVRAK